MFQHALIRLIRLLITQKEPSRSHALYLRKGPNDSAVPPKLASGIRMALLHYAALQLHKSAITQICNKLSEKGLIEKYQRGQNRKERYFSLTPQGEAVRLSHQEVHREAEETMRRYLCGLDAESKRIIMDFMEKMRQTMPIGVFTCPCEQEGQACISQKRNQEACSHA